VTAAVLRDGSLVDASLATVRGALEGRDDWRHPVNKKAKE
jgi:hypothetical protein